MALDAARERAKGEAKIGTTGRGIGPAYEDKVARRAIRVQDLYARERFAAKLGEVLDYHNFVLKNYFKADVVDFQKTLDETLALGESLKPMVADVSGELNALIREGKSILFEGAQAALLDIDHGTYPFVTSSNCLAGQASRGRGRGAAATALHPGRRQGLRHARGRRAVPDGTRRRSGRAPARAAATSSAPSPGGRGAAAGSTRPRSSARCS